MKRRDILKSIEVALVVKAYEVGHRSERKDGVYEKQSDGSWQRISGYDKDSHQWKLDKRQRSLTPSEIHELVQIDDIDERRKRQSEMLSQPAPDTDDSAERAEYERQLTEEQNRRAEEDPTGYGYEEPPSSGKYDEITEEDLIETPKFDSNEDREFDSLQKSITKMYDTGTLKDDISQIPADSSGSNPDEKEVREFVDGLLQMHDMSRSRLTTDHLDSLEDQIADLWHKGKVGKSAVRDMRSAPAIKNMGF